MTQMMIGYPYFFFILILDFYFGKRSTRKASRMSRSVTGRRLTNAISIATANTSNDTAAPGI
jgi:hypothetical protein